MTRIGPGGIAVAALILFVGVGGIVTQYEVNQRAAIDRVHAREQIEAHPLDPLFFQQRCGGPSSVSRKDDSFILTYRDQNVIVVYNGPRGAYRSVTHWQMQPLAVLRLPDVIERLQCRTPEASPSVQ